MVYGLPTAVAVVGVAVLLYHYCYYDAFSLNVPLVFQTRAPSELDDARGSQPRSVLHFVYSVECNTYMEWQTIAFEHSFVTIRQKGNLTRILACNNPARDDGLRDYPLVSNTFHHPSYTDRDKREPPYAPLNKPVGIDAWLRATDLPRDTVVVILDVDMILTRRLPEPHPHKVQGRPIGAHYDYMTYKGLPLAPDWVAAPGHPRDAQPVGVPILIHVADLTRITATWSNLTTLLHRNSTVRTQTEDNGWTAEMYAYSFAAAHHSLRHTVRDDLMLYPPAGYTTTAPWILHYGIGFSTGGASFDKHDYHGEHQNPLNCSVPWPWMHGQQVPAVLRAVPRHHRDTGSAGPGMGACHDARGQAGAALVIEMVHEAVHWYRKQFAQCPHDPDTIPELRARVLDPPSFWYTVDNHYGCVTDDVDIYTGQARPLPADLDQGGLPVDNTSAVYRVASTRYPSRAPQIATMNRARMDSDVALAGLDHYPVSNVSERVIVDGVVSERECMTLIDLLDRTYRVTRGDTDIYGFEGQDVSAASAREIDTRLPGQVALLGDVHERIVAVARDAFPISDLHFDFTHATRRTTHPNGFHERRGHLIHADQCLDYPNGTCVQTPDHCCAWRDVSAVMFLNDRASPTRPFTGGEFVFVSNPVGDGAIHVEPKCGRVALFTSGRNNLHGVLPVNTGYRYAIASWLTVNASHEDVEYNKLVDTYRLDTDRNGITIHRSHHGT